MLTFDELLGKEAYDRGFARGFARGFEMGKVEGKREVLLRQLALRFGTLPDSVWERVGGAGSEDLERWAERILDATSLDDVFAG